MHLLLLISQKIKRHKWQKIGSIQLLVAMVLYTACVPLKPGGSTSGTDSDGGATYAKNKVAINDDKIYEANIRTVMFFPQSSNPNAVLDLPVVFLGAQKERPLYLSFDELGSQYHNYYVKILACNYDWTPAILQELEYLEQFNEFPITDYELSSGTRVPYTRYATTIPPVKLSGNYIAKVYRNQDPDDVVITRRFTVFENAVSVKMDLKFSIDPAYRFTHQQVDFNVMYPDFDLFNPNQMVKVVVRQNGRWDNAIYDLQPAFVREEAKTLDYHLLNNENIFGGMNEWRGLDARSMRFLGQGMDAAKFDNSKAEVTIIPDKSRNEANYSQWIDVNGRFVPMNFETRNATVVPDYQFINFKLNSKQLRGDVYVFGGLSDFKADPRFKMSYDTANSQYTARILLKQGFYNYAYAVQEPGKSLLNTTIFEGDYNMTENLYDVTVYFRPIGSRYDRCIAYQSFDYFDRDAKR